MGRWFQINLARVRGLVSFALVVATAFSPPATHAGTIPESERWATITHPGNAAYIPPPNSQYPHPPGRVDYEYQISRTETTGAEWLEFVQAYAPFVDPPYANSTGFTSDRVRATEVAPGIWQYSLRTGGANRAVRVEWQYAARFCNWLHNNKGSDQVSFENGAYDTSTFGGTAQDGYTSQHARNPGAQYFIPTTDEWVKAAYWDQRRFNPSIGDLGYWQFPNTSDVQLVPGVPGIGQTSAGQTGSFEVGSYTDVQSPWGLWDLSGGVSEWLETPVLRGDGLVRYRYYKGTYTPSTAVTLYQDEIDWAGATFEEVSLGIRIARMVPMPGVTVTFSALMLVVLDRRRR